MSRSRCTPGHLHTLCSHFTVMLEPRGNICAPVSLDTIKRTGQSRHAVKSMYVYNRRGYERRSDVEIFSLIVSGQLDKLNRQHTQRRISLYPSAHIIMLHITNFCFFHLLYSWTFPYQCNGDFKYNYKCRAVTS